MISAYSCCPGRGSEPGNGWSWVTGYVNSGYQVVCVTSNRYRDQLDPYAKGELITGLQFEFVGTSAMDRLLRLPLFGDYIHYFSWLFSARKRLKQLSEERPPDIVQHVTYCQIRYGTPVYGLPGISVVGPLGGNAPIHRSLRKYLLGGKVKMAVLSLASRMIMKMNPMVRWSLNDADIVLYSNSIIKAILSRYECKRMLHMPDAGLPDSYKMGPPMRNINGKVEVVWVGRVLESKGLNLALEAMRRLRPSRKYVFTVIGDGPFLKNCVQLAGAMVDEGTVRFVGKIPYGEVLEYYKAADIFLFPSLKDSCPMQVYEAMAHGLPVVTLDHQGLRDQVVEGTGLKVPVGDDVDYPQELADAIRSLTSDASTYGDFSRAAYLHGQKQVWSNRIRGFLSMVESEASNESGCQ